jgi:hypothetical protein
MNKYARVSIVVREERGDGDEGQYWCPYCGRLHDHNEALNNTRLTPCGKGIIWVTRSIPDMIPSMHQGMIGDLMKNYLTQKLQIGFTLDSIEVPASSVDWDILVEREHLLSGLLAEAKAYVHRDKDDDGLDYYYTTLKPRLLTLVGHECSRVDEPILQGCAAYDIAISQIVDALDPANR